MRYLYVDRSYETLPTSNHYRNDKHNIVLEQIALFTMFQPLLRTYMKSEEVASWPTRGWRGKSMYKYFIVLRDP